MKTKVFDVEEGGRKQTIFIPGADEMDRHELEDLVQWQEEKTRDELRKIPTKQRNHSKADVGKALGDYNKFRQRVREGTKKYY